MQKKGGGGFSKFSKDSVKYAKDKGPHGREPAGSPHVNSGLQPKRGGSARPLQNK